MLGLRHYKGFAIDLWQGAFEDFSTDLLAYFTGHSEGKDPREADLVSLRDDPRAVVRSALPASESADAMTLTAAGNFPACQIIHCRTVGLAGDSDCEAMFHVALGLGFRHLTVVAIFKNQSAANYSSQPEPLFSALKRCLDESPAGSSALSRVTLVLPDAASYRCFQNIFFATFPDSIQPLDGRSR
jgi:hypothetical protein